MTFGEVAGRLAGITGVAIGWSPDAFWAATPAELALVARALRAPGEGVGPPDAATLARMKEAFPDG